VTYNIARRLILNTDTGIHAHRPFNSSEESTTQSIVFSMVDFVM
jgi:hypothetical protein